MGARNVSGALALYRHLDHRAMRLLVGMALTALDAPIGDTPARLYYGGQDAMADLLGYDVPPRDDDDPAVTKLRRNAHEQVRRALADLRAAGAIDVKVKAVNGRRAVYLLHVATIPGAVDDDGVVVPIRRTRPTARVGLRPTLRVGLEPHPQGGS